MACAMRRHLTMIDPKPARRERFNTTCAAFVCCLGRGFSACF